MKNRGKSIRKIESETLISQNILIQYFEACRLMPPTHQRFKDCKELRLSSDPGLFESKILRNSGFPWILGFRNYRRALSYLRYLCLAPWIPSLLVAWLPSSLAMPGCVAPSFPGSMAPRRPRARNARDCSHRLFDPPPRRVGPP